MAGLLNTIGRSSKITQLYSSQLNNEQEAKLKIVGGEMSWSNQQLYNICNCLITFSIVLTRELTCYPEAMY